VVPALSVLRLARPGLFVEPEVSKLEFFFCFCRAYLVDFFVILSELFDEICIR
jgi:hypothetical protein